MYEFDGHEIFELALPLMANELLTKQEIIVITIAPVIPSLLSLAKYIFLKNLQIFCKTYQKF